MAESVIGKQRIVEREGLHIERLDAYNGGDDDAKFFSMFELNDGCLPTANEVRARLDKDGRVYKDVTYRPPLWVTAHECVWGSRPRNMLHFGGSYSTDTAGVRQLFPDIPADPLVFVANAMSEARNQTGEGYITLAFLFIVSPMRQHKEGQPHEWANLTILKYNLRLK